MHSIWYLILPDRVLINFDVPQYIAVISPLSRLVKPTLLDRLQAYPRYQLSKKADTPRRATPDKHLPKVALLYIKNMTSLDLRFNSSLWTSSVAIIQRKPDHLRSPISIVWTSLISVAIWNAKRFDQLRSPTIIVRVYELVWSQL